MSLNTIRTQICAENARPRTASTPLIWTIYSRDNLVVWQGRALSFEEALEFIGTSPEEYKKEGCRSDTRETL